MWDFFRIVFHSEQVSIYVDLHGVSVHDNLGSIDASDIFLTRSG